MISRVLKFNVVRTAVGIAMLIGSAAISRGAGPTTQSTTQPSSFAAKHELLSTQATTRPAEAHAIRVAIYNGLGGKPLGNGERNVARCLAAGGKFELQMITAEQIRAGMLENFDVLVQSGCGNGGSQAKALEASGRDAIRAFVGGGGGYVGICAGAYLATSEYPWSLGILNAKLVDPARWARGKGDVRVAFNADARSLLNIRDRSLPMRFVQGPLLMPANSPELPAYQALAEFEDAIAENGAPAEQMIGATAAAMASYDRGRVICLSPHAEATAGYEGILRRAVSWSAGRVVD